MKKNKRDNSYVEEERKVAYGSRGEIRTIAFFLPSLDFGGVERVMINLMMGMLDQGCRVDLLVANASGSNLLQLDRRVNLIDLKSRRVAASLLPIVRYLQANKPSVLITAKNYASVIALFAKMIALSKTKTIVTQHSMLSCETHSSVRSRIIIHFIRFLLRRADNIVAVSAAVADDLSNYLHLDRKRIRVIYNPVVTPYFFELSKMPVDHPWFVHKNTPIIIAAGRLAKEKGFDQLIHAFNIVRHSVASRLVIFGEGSERTHLEDLCVQLHITELVSLPGYVDNIPSYISRANVFVLSSLYESLPTVVIEALATKTPVVAYRCAGGISEILSDKSYGSLVSPGDITGLASAIRSSLSAPGVDITEEAWSRFTLPHAVEQYREIM